MKLNFGRRLVLFVHWLLSLAFVALGVALFVWPECRATVASLLKSTDVFIYAVAVLVVYLLFAAGAVGIAFGGRKRDKDHGFIVVDSSENGRTRIAVGAVEQMIRQAVRGVSGIADMRAAIVNSDDSISINVDVAIRNGAHVPSVTANIQRAIRSYIELNCGVAVRGVSVSVHSLMDEEQQSGRRGKKKKTESGFYTNQTPVGNVDAYTNRPASVPEMAVPEPIAEPAPVIPPVVEPVAPAPEPEPVSAPVEAAVEEPAPEETAPAVEESAPAPKKRRFGRFFGRKKEEAPEAPAEEVSAVEEAPAAEETFAEEAAPEAAEAVEAVEADAAEDIFEAEAPEAGFEAPAEDAADEERDGKI